MIKPISPNVVNQVVNVDHYTEKINSFLAKPWSDYDRRTGRWYNAGGMTQPEREALMRLFTEAGWVVRWQDDQRDGASLVFNPTWAE